MILQKLKGMNKVDHDEPEPETVRVMKKLKHVMANDEGTAVFETHLENVKPDQTVKWIFVVCIIKNKLVKNKPNVCRFLLKYVILHYKFVIKILDLNLKNWFNLNWSFCKSSGCNCYGFLYWDCHAFSINKIIGYNGPSL